jgi:hypothetical protein
MHRWSKCINRLIALPASSMSSCAAIQRYHARNGAITCPMRSFRSHRTIHERGAVPFGRLARTEASLVGGRFVAHQIFNEVSDQLMATRVPRLRIDASRLLTDCLFFDTACLGYLFHGEPFDQ